MTDMNIVETETVTKRDRLKAFAKKYGLIILGGTALAVISYGAGKKAERNDWADTLEDVEFVDVKRIENEDGTLTYEALTGDITSDEDTE